jgi:Leucine-rich repeat (LRR) protein
MSDGKLETIKKDTFSDLKNLLNLQLRKNNLKSIPDNIFQKNNKLKILNLGYNKLESFPRTAVKRTMKRLYLNNNEDLEVRESTFDNLKNAVELHLQDINNGPNELQTICRNLKRKGNIKRDGECCYATKNGNWGQAVPLCE